MKLSFPLLFSFLSRSDVSVQVWNQRDTRAGANIKNWISEFTPNTTNYFAKSTKCNKGSSKVWRSNTRMPSSPAIFRAHRTIKDCTVNQRCPPQSFKGLNKLFSPISIWYQGILTDIEAVILTRSTSYSLFLTQKQNRRNHRRIDKDFISSSAQLKETKETSFTQILLSISTVPSKGEKTAIKNKNLRKMPNQVCNSVPFSFVYTKLVVSINSYSWSPNRHSGKNSTYWTSNCSSSFSIV